MAREFISVSRVGDIASGQALQITVEGRWVALFNIGGTYDCYCGCDCDSALINRY